LVSKGHNVTIFTSYHDHQRTFKEAIDGTFPVVVKGNLIPREYRGKGHVLFAILKSWYLACHLLIQSFRGDRYDVFIVDQVSASIPILRMTGTKILFYCHFPDKLLTKRQTLLKTLYRLPVDLLEELTTKMAHVIVVNSEFTLSVFKKSFTWIPTSPTVLYPGIKLEAYEESTTKSGCSLSIPNNKKIILSINRFERKKNIALAIQTFEALKSHAEFSNLFLVVAGTIF
jgi:alpha-1,3/alpha-1,6-mannosyltransferase